MLGQYHALTFTKTLDVAFRHRGDVAYEPGERVKVDFKEMRDEIAATFYLEPTLMEDVGDFTVRAHNPAGDAAETFKLSVIGEWR